MQLTVRSFSGFDAEITLDLKENAEYYSSGNLQRDDSVLKMLFLSKLQLFLLIYHKARIANVNQ